MTKTTQRFLVMLLMNPKIWFFMQLLMWRYDPPTEKKGEYQFTRRPPHKKAIWPEETLDNTREYQRRMMPFFLRAVSAYYSGYHEEAMEICFRILPKRPFELQHHIDHYDMRHERRLFREDTAWEGFLKFFFPENCHIHRSMSGPICVRFKADRTVTKEHLVDEEGYRALFEEQRNTNEIEEIKVESEFNGLLKLTVTRRNKEPPMFEDMWIYTNRPLPMTRKSKRKRERKRLWSRNRIR